MNSRKLGVQNRIFAWRRNFRNAVEDFQGAALRLTQQGYDVTVLEKMLQPGGMMTYGIPSYRLPRAPLFAAREVILRRNMLFRNAHNTQKESTRGTCAF